LVIGAPCWHLARLLPADLPGLLVIGFAESDSLSVGHAPSCAGRARDRWFVVFTWSHTGRWQRCMGMGVGGSTPTSQTQHHACIHSAFGRIHDESNPLRDELGQVKAGGLGGFRIIWNARGRPRIVCLQQLLREPNGW